MRQQYGRRVMPQRRFNHFTGMNLGTIDRPFEESFVRDQAVLVIQKEHRELFTRQRALLQA
ncbi:Uncharacterised protein [Yersinia intermedia]|nr:Uncharacterised protein [Yersinia intermedia]